MKVISIYELLGLIKDGKAPKKIKYNDDEYIHIDNYCYFCEETNEILSQNIYAEFSRLNDEVEILDEEEFIDIEEITLNGEKIGYGVLSEWLGSKQTDNEVKLCSSIECLGITLNLLIKNQKKIIERINKDN